LRNRFRSFYHFLEAVYVAREMEKRGISHIHTHFAAGAASVAMIVHRLTGIPFSFTAHAFDLYKDPILLVEKIRSAEIIATISEYNKTYMKKLVPEIDGAKIHVIHCGIDMEVFTPVPRESDGAIRILSVGRLEEKKGHRYLIEACSILKQRAVDFRCMIVGEGVERDALQALIDAYGLQDSVVLKGAVFQEEIRAFYEDTDIFALACVSAGNADIDGIPVVLMEAMAMEIPAISTNISGIPELIEDGGNGMLVPQRDADALAEAIHRLIQDESLRETIRRNGRITVERAFDLRSEGAKLMDLFRESMKYAGERRI